MDPAPPISEPSPPTAGKTSGLAIAALVCGIIGVCLPCPVGLVAVVLGIVALTQMNKDPSLGGKGFAIAGIAVPFLSLLLILPAIAIPNFIKFQARSKQAECKANLRSWYTAEKAYFVDKDRYSEDFAEVGFSPERGNRYAYIANIDGPLEERSDAAAGPSKAATRIGPDVALNRDLPAARILAHHPPVTGASLGATGTCPKCEIAAACVGQISNSDTLDVWSVSTAERKGRDEETIAAGVPYNETAGL